MAEAAIGVPSGHGVKDALKDFGVGAIGGLGYAMVASMTGASFLGLAIAGVLAGSLIKGNRGEIIATVCGFLAISALMGGTAGAATSTQGEM
jgi:hypothetical protein